MAFRDYSSAISDFQSALQIDPTNIAAANDRAICFLYVGHLNTAIASLEDIIRRDPVRTLCESLVLNLCTLYDLAPGPSIDKKRLIQQIVIKWGPDDFDPAALKLGSAAS